MLPTVALMTQRLEGKTALVTGSTGSIGRTVAMSFAEEGAHVVVSGRDETRGREVVAAIEERGGRASFVRADLDGSVSASTALAEEAVRRVGGRLDILVNN